MHDVSPQTLDWIDSAPVSVTRIRAISASDDAVWSVIADHAGWADWFSGIVKVVPGAVDHGVGGTRTVHLRGAAVEEEFLAWEPGAHFAFTVTGATRPVVRSLVENLRIDGTGGRCIVSYTMAIAPAGPRFVASLLRPAVGVALNRGLAGLARQAESL